MNDKFLRAVGLAVVTFTLIALGAFVVSRGLSLLTDILDWLRYNALPYGIGAAFIGGLIYVIHSAMTK
jgi:hypothetical protein